MCPRCPVIVGLLLLGVTGAGQALQLRGNDRERGLLMLRTIRRDLEKRYYDSTFHGLNLAALFDSAETDIRSASSNGDVFGIIAGTLLRLNDSHTFFFPPERVARVEYGWSIRMVGDTAFIVDVARGSDAAAQGLKTGDAVLAVDRYQPTRRTLKRLLYLYHALRPVEAVSLIVRAPEPGAAPRRVIVHAKVTQGKPILNLSGQNGDADFWDLIRRGEHARHASADRFAPVGSDVLVWQLKGFTDQDQMDRGMKRAAHYAGLVVDARNNGGGSLSALMHLMSDFLDHVDTVATTHRRNETVPLVSTPSRRPYTGKLVVLVDAGSASATEVFARTMQRTQRGTILGDTTAGAVMQSRLWPHSIGADIVVVYGVSVTDADIIMPDGGRLENLGVVPDIIVLPSGKDLADGRDPALARAITLAGHAVDADSVGRLFPPESERQ